MKTGQKMALRGIWVSVCAPAVAVTEFVREERRTAAAAAVVVVELVTVVIVVVSC